MSRLQCRLTPKVSSADMQPLNNNPAQPPEKEKEVKPRLPCVCNRAKQLVLCQRCGFTCQGRVKGRCAQHPGALFLLDISSCPSCRAGLQDLKEFPQQREEELPPRQRLNSVKKRKCEVVETMET